MRVRPFDPVLPLLSGRLFTVEQRHHGKILAPRHLLVRSKYFLSCSCLTSAAAPESEIMCLAEAPNDH
jgi:hypothetical protein